MCLFFLSYIDLIAKSQWRRKVNIESRITCLIRSSLKLCVPVNYTSSCEMSEVCMTKTCTKLDMFMPSSASVNIFKVPVEFETIKTVISLNVSRLNTYPHRSFSCSFISLHYSFIHWSVSHPPSLFQSSLYFPVCCQC